MTKELIDEIIDIYTHKKTRPQLVEWEDYKYISKMWRKDYEKACDLIKKWEVNVYDEILTSDDYADYCLERGEYIMPEEDFKFLKDVFW